MRVLQSAGRGRSFSHELDGLPFRFAGGLSPVLFQGGPPESHPYIMHRHVEWSREKERRGFLGYLTFVIEGRKRWAIFPSTDAQFLYRTDEWFNPNKNMHTFHFNPFSPDFEQFP